MDPFKRAATLLVAASAAVLALLYAVVGAEAPPGAEESVSVGGFTFHPEWEPSRLAVIPLAGLAMGLAWSAGHLVEGRRTRLGLVSAGGAFLVFPAVASYHFAGGLWMGALFAPLSLGASALVTLAGGGALLFLARPESPRTVC